AYSAAKSAVVRLTESMAAETEASAAALRRLLPLTLGAEGERRWGWVGFRDEVVDRFALTADGDAFLATLQRWRCERGGDVPEGVDEALFEALRFDSFEWNPKARHIFLVIGDAPPPYERISGMVSLVEAAHASPEGFEVRCLGILREAWIEGVPGFQELADASGGMAIFEREGEPLLEAWWRLIVGSAAPAWGEGPFAGGGG
ncbi:MAG: hypothetical protein ACE5GW_11930, partial [Planctomycetota bacterium]